MRKGVMRMKKILDFLKESKDIEKFIRQNKDVIAKCGVVAAVIVIGIFVFILGDEGGGEKEETKEIAIEETKSEADIFVDVGGEVVNPSVVELEDGSRVSDAIEAAGGLTENADITDINRAAFVSDGEKIYIPSSVVDIEGNTVSGGSVQGYSDGKVNINTADSEQLQELDGVGPVTAEKIIDYRNENGRFTDPEDLKNVSGIGDKTYEKLKDDIKVW